MARIVGELFREPDAQLGYSSALLTMGMLLSLPLMAVGVWLISAGAGAAGVTALAPDLIELIASPIRPDTGRPLHGRCLGHPRLGYY